VPNSLSEGELAGPFDETDMADAHRRSPSQVVISMTSVNDRGLGNCGEMVFSVAGHHSGVDPSISVNKNVTVPNGNL
jgi:hypothetical protein